MLQAVMRPKLLAVLLVLGFVLVTSLDASLAAMHPDGAASGGASAVTAPTALFSPGSVAPIVEGWASWALVEPNTEQFLRPGWLLRAYAFADMLLIAGPLTLLVALGLRAASLRALALGGQAKQPGRIAWRVRWAAPLIYLAADGIENVLLVMYVMSSPDAVRLWLLRLIGAAAAVKWAGLAVAAGGLLLALVATRVQRRTVNAEAGLVSPPRIRQVLVALRPQLATAVAVVFLLLLLPGDVGRQVGDLVLALPDNQFQFLLAPLAALVLGLGMLLTGRASSRAYFAEPKPPRVLTCWHLGLIAAVGAVLAVPGLIIALSFERSWGWPLTLLGSLAVAFAVLSFAVDREAAAVGWLDPRPDGEAAYELSPEVVVPLLRWLAAAPAIALAAAALRGTVVLAVVRDVRGVLWLLALTAVALALAGWMLKGERVGAFLVGLTEEAAEPRWWQLAALCAIAAVALALAGARMPGPVVGAMGALAVVFWVFAALLLALVSLTIAGDRLPTSGVLSFLGLRRFPLIALVLVLAVGGSALNRDGRYHDVVLGDRVPDDLNVAMDVRDAFEAWTKQLPAPADDETRPHVPMVFLASAGGGIRAAYWTTIALDCLAGEPMVRAEAVEQGETRENDICHEIALPTHGFDHLFAASGISGGSVGLAGWSVTKRGESHQLLESQQFLARNLAAMAFRDLPNGLLQSEWWSDRAASMEQAWVDAIPALDKGFFASAYDKNGELRFPLLILNGATVDDGCRLSASVLDLAPAVDRDAEPEDQRALRSCVRLNDTRVLDTSDVNRAMATRHRDLADFACPPGEDNPRDVSLAAAAHLSARFPYVSPSGGLTACTREGKDGEQRRTFVVDGGVIESAGVGPLVDVWLALAPMIERYNATKSNPVCLAPRLLLLDNGYVRSSRQAPPRRPAEMLAPLQAVQSAGRTVTAAARQALVLAFEAAMEKPAPCAGGAYVGAAGGSSVAHLYPTLHPGPMAPLGWTLSSWSELDLRRQLLSSRNAKELQRVQSWFDG